MRLIIAGSRSFTERLAAPLLDVGLAHFRDVTEVVSGGARGPDAAGERWARRRGIPVRRFLPDWSLGKVAGPLRNQEMLEYAAPDGHLVALWDGYSNGTLDMITRARRAGLRVTVIR